MNLEAFKKHLRWSEGVRRFPYVDTTGHTSIGVGRNLTDNGLRDEEVEFLLENDALDAIRDAATLPYWDELSDTRKLVVADCVFNMGLPTWKTFRKANAALNEGDYIEAAREMQSSRWFRQTGRRAIKLVNAMLTDELDG